jgi:ribonucleotide monophosphatase NagD (HAD superfamily)
VFVIGEEPLERALGAAGIRPTEDPGQIDIVVASYDPETVLGMLGSPAATA